LIASADETKAIIKIVCAQLLERLRQDGVARVRREEPDHNSRHHAAKRDAPLPIVQSAVCGHEGCLRLES
jgi:hypothetical protein